MVAFYCPVYYENNTDLSKEYWTTKRNHFTPIVTWRPIRKCSTFNTTKKKCYLCLNEKLKIASYRKDNLLNKRSELIRHQNKCRHQNKFTLLRNDSKDQELCFHCDASCYIPIVAHVLACAVYVLHIWFSKQKSSSSKRRFHWRILRGIFPVKTTRK